MAGESYTLTEVARLLGVPQHRLIHLCEKGVVIPKIHGADGRGSSRVFSPLNFLELAVALRLRDMLLPVSAVRGIVQVLSGFGETMQGRRKSLSLPEHLRQESAPDLRVIISDGSAMFFSLGPVGGQPKLFGGIPLEVLMASTPDEVQISTVKPKSPVGDGFGGPEGSEYVRLELSVNAVARSLPID